MKEKCAYCGRDDRADPLHRFEYLSQAELVEYPSYVWLHTDTTRGCLANWMYANHTFLRYEPPR